MWNFAKDKYFGKESTVQMDQESILCLTFLLSVLSLAISIAAYVRG